MFNRMYAMQILPGGGTCVAMVATGANRSPIVVGKPHPYMINAAIQEYVCQVVFHRAEYG
jgi:ribonucleotide monophosphatase NagD (HAD superfamily)